MATWYSPRMSRRLACFLILLSCSSNNGNGPGSNAPADAPAHTTSSEGVTIGAANVHEVSSVATIKPAQGHEFIAVDITLTNSGAKAEALDPAQFALETAAGIAFTASPVTSEYTDPCDPSASVEPAATGKCSAVFEVDSTSLSSLIYTLADGTTASVAVSLATTTTGGGSLGAACGPQQCAAPLMCLGGSGFKSTCQLTCTSTEDTSCAQAYTGSGTAACFPSGSAALCIIGCVGGTNQCPGILVCDGADGSSGVGQGEMGFCAPPAQ